MRSFKSPWMAALLCVGASAVSAQNIPIQNPGFEEGVASWTLIQHVGTPAYTFTIDKDRPFAGKSSGKIEQTAEQIFGSIKQRVDVRAYAGKRVKLTAMIRAKDIKESGGLLYVRVDGPGDTILGYDFTSGRTKGTHDWKPAKVVVEVPTNSVILEFGLMLDNWGALWGDNFALEVTNEAVTFVPKPATPDILTFDTPPPEVDEDERRGRKRVKP